MSTEGRRPQWKDPLYFVLSSRGQPDINWKTTLWVVEAPVLAIRCLSGLAAPEVSRRNRLPIALMRQQLNKPCLVFDLFVQDARSHIVGARIFSKGHIADRA